MQQELDVRPPGRTRLRLFSVVATVAGSAAVLFAVAGCGTSTVDQSSEVDLVNKALQGNHLKAKSVDCPSDVEAKQGQTFTCTAALTNGTTATINAEVQNVSSDHATLHITSAHIGKGG
jgi:Domain of unknown function (DUF4333)